MTEQHDDTCHHPLQCRDHLDDRTKHYDARIVFGRITANVGKVQIEGDDGSLLYLANSRHRRIGDAGQPFLGDAQGVMALLAKQFGNLEQVILKEPDKEYQYLFLNDKGKPIYIGKARSLRNRVRTYFQDSRNLDPRLSQMMISIEDAPRAPARDVLKTGIRHSQPAAVTKTRVKVSVTTQLRRNPTFLHTLFVLLQSLR